MPAVALGGIVRIDGTRCAIALGGVVMSVGLVAGGAAAMPAGSNYGPSLSGLSVACFAAFFALNPLHFVILALLSGSRWLRAVGIPSWAGLAALAAVDLAWWWYASGALLKLVRRRRAARSA